MKDCKFQNKKIIFLSGETDTVQESDDPIKNSQSGVQRQSETGKGQTHFSDENETPDAALIVRAPIRAASPTIHTTVPSTNAASSVRNAGIDSIDEDVSYMLTPSAPTTTAEKKTGNSMTPESKEKELSSTSTPFELLEDSTECLRASYRNTDGDEDSILSIPTMTFCDDLDVDDISKLSSFIEGESTPEFASDPTAGDNANDGKSMNTTNAASNDESANNSCNSADVTNRYSREPCDKPTVTVPVDPEIPLDEYTDEGNRYYLMFMRGDLLVHQTDTVYLLRDITITTNPVSTSSSSVKKHTYKTIGKIGLERMWKDNNGNRFVYGHHYLRPQETYHEPT